MLFFLLHGMLLGALLRVLCGTGSDWALYKLSAFSPMRKYLFAVFDMCSSQTQGLVGRSVGWRELYLVPKSWKER